MIPLRDNLRTRRFPWINSLLIAGNILAFVHELKVEPDLLEGFVRQWGVIPEQLLVSPVAEWPTVLTAMFLHGSWTHILGNLLYLWVFGDNVEDRLGHLRYLLFYVLVGISATLSQVFLHPTSSVPLIGASGAIAGVLGAYFVLHPKARVTTVIPIWIFLRITEVPAYFFLGFWFLIQLFQSTGSLLQGPLKDNVGGVAWAAHAGGFMAGVGLQFILRQKHRR